MPSRRHTKDVLGHQIPWLFSTCTNCTALMYILPCIQQTLESITLGFAPSGSRAHRPAITTCAGPEPLIALSLSASIILIHVLMYTGIHLLAQHGQIKAHLQQTLHTYTYHQPPCIIYAAYIINLSLRDTSFPSQINLSLPKIPRLYLARGEIRTSGKPAPAHF